MPKPAVLLTTRIPGSVLALLEEACDVDAHSAEDHHLTRDELIARVPGKQGLVALPLNPVDRAVIEAGRDLRVISNIAVGYNNIDVAAAHERGIVVTNTPDVLTDATANLTWALILDITRRITEGDRLVRHGGWKRFTMDFLLGTDLQGRQLGIVGMGRIGQAVGARAAAFGMTVAYTSRSPRDIPGAQHMTLDRLLATSDIVSLHCPLTPESKGLIDQAAFARMKRSAYLINASRGPVVDESALLWALKNGIISGAGLDVYDKEPDLNPEFLTLENVVLSPHLGSATRETRTAMANLAVRNVLAVLEGKEAVTPVGK